MQWFDNWIRKKFIQAWESTRTHEQKPDSYPIAMKKIINFGSCPQPPNSLKFDVRPITLNLYRATSGWVVEYSHYDITKDLSNSQLYVINDDQELGEQLSQIVTFQLMKE